MKILARSKIEVCREDSSQYRLLTVALSMCSTVGVFAEEILQVYSL